MSFDDYYLKNLLIYEEYEKYLERFINYQKFEGIINHQNFPPSRQEPRRHEIHLYENHKSLELEIYRQTCVSLQHQGPHSIQSQTLQYFSYEMNRSLQHSQLQTP